MLKIKDDVDLKELEKFKFKPKYDEDTGKIKYWYKNIYDWNFYNAEYMEYVIELGDKIYYRKTYFKRKRKDVKNVLNLKMAKKGTAFEMFFDTLYDLIKAGLVEKVGE